MIEEKLFYPALRGKIETTRSMKPMSKMTASRCWSTISKLRARGWILWCQGQSVIGKRSSTMSIRRRCPRRACSPSAARPMWIP